MITIKGVITNRFAIHMTRLSTGHFIVSSATATAVNHSELQVDYEEASNIFDEYLVRLQDFFEIMH